MQGEPYFMKVEMLASWRLQRAWCGVHVPGPPMCCRAATGHLAAVGRSVFGLSESGRPPAGFEGPGPL